METKTKIKTVPGNKMLLMPVKPGNCKECGVKHLPEEPHNALSLFYIFTFSQKNGRAPTWKDAIAHCSPEIKKAWKTGLKARGLWI